ncbi:Uncharacterised protein [Klebsiella pneumoniae]|nr:Uncharacterised protein [Klebsiella pneumoniae]
MRGESNNDFMEEDKLYLTSTYCNEYDKLGETNFARNNCSLI